VRTAVWPLIENAPIVDAPSATSPGDDMSSSFLQGVAFFALSVIILSAAFGGFGAL
jgi:hypothetical protein